MSKVESAALNYALSKYPDTFPTRASFDAFEFTKTDFLAGAAWQREQDAKLAEEIGLSHAPEYGQSFYNGAKRAALAIRAQGSKQEAAE